MGSRLWRVYDIVYVSSIKNIFKKLPKEMYVDLEKYGWYSSISSGLGHLNCAVRRAIEEETGAKSLSCRVQVVSAKTLKPLDYYP